MIRRVLKPGGQLHLIEFGKINHWIRWLYWWQSQPEPVGDHLSGQLPRYILQARFKQLKEVGLLFHVFLFQARKL